MSIAFVAGLGGFLFGLLFLVAPKRVLVGVAKIGAIARRLVSVSGVQLAVTRGQGTIRLCFRVAVASHLSKLFALFGAPVSLLGPQITLLGAFNENLHAGVGLDGIHLVQHRVLVALTLVRLLLATVCPAFSLTVLPLTPIGPPVTPIGLAVPSIGRAVTLVSWQVPLSDGIALVGGAVALTGRTVPRLGSAKPLRRVAVPQLRRQIASLLGLLTLLRRLSRVDLTLSVFVGEGWPQLLRPLRGDPVPPFGDLVTRVGHPVTLVGHAVTLISSPVTLVGVALALALVRLGSHPASLPAVGPAK